MSEATERPHDEDDAPTDPGPTPGPVDVTLPVVAIPTLRAETDHGPPHRLAPGAVNLWRLQRLIRLAVMGIPLYGAMGFGLASVTSFRYGVAAAVALVGVNLVISLVWPPFQVAAWTYAVREHDLLVQSGVLFRRWSSVPLSRIQHVDTRQGPLERMFGLQRLLVYTAAGVSADGVIPALTDHEAQRIRDVLSRRGGDDGV